MNSSLIKCLQLILAIANCQLLLALAPSMIPASPEIYLNEGEPLEITCKGFKKLNFYYPNSPGDANTSAAHIEQVQLDVYEIKIRREKTVYGDTGWYGCAESDVNVTRNLYNETDVTWMYVYVQSNVTFFVNNQSLQNFQVVVGEKLLIGCRPTSPKYHVEFSITDSDVNEIEIAKRGSYDPRTGFTIDSIETGDNGFFQCEIRSNNDIQKLTYLILVLSKQISITKPIIDTETLGYVVQGQELRINCSVDLNYDVFVHHISWTTPQNSSRIKIARSRILTGGNSFISIAELIIENVEFNDEGEYVCTFSASKKSASTKIFIKVNDPSQKFINLTPYSDQVHYEHNLGSDVIWVVNITAHPFPEITWLDPHNQPITTDYHKYVVNRTLRRTSLKIRDIEMSDTGVYTLLAENEDDPSLIQRLNFNLTILCAPLVMDFEKIKRYYTPNEFAEFSCEIAAYPPPNVTWTFRDSGMDADTSPQHLENFTNKVIHSRTTSTLTMQMITPGNLTCEAYNQLGNHSFAQPLKISDMEDDFGILELSNDTAVGDDVELSCGASTHISNHPPEWVMDEETKKNLSRTKKMTISNSKTPFTHFTTLRLYNVDKSDGRHYVCRITIDNVTQQDVQELVVHDAVEPYFMETNINGTENIYESEIARKTIITLECHVGGMPPPDISWWKDDQIIEATEDLYTISDDNQELQIKYPRPSDSGKYYCRAKNRLKTIEMYQSITVQSEEVSKVLIISMIISLIICVILVVYFSIKMHREKVMRTQLMEAGLTHFEEGALECLNPELTVDDQAELLPYDKKWEFPRERLTFGKQLGCGAFGVVMKAEAQGICESETVTIVAVKMVRRSTESTYIRALASELKIMVHLGKHLNVVNLLGACTRNIAKRELLVIVEYCRFGNLHNYLLRHRSEFINQIDLATGRIDSTIGNDLLTRSVSVGSNNRIKYAALSFSRSISKDSNSGPELLSYTSGSDFQDVNMTPDGMILSNNSIQPGWRSNYRGDYKDQNLKPICTQDLLSWAFQVARGMEYLCQRKVLHGDLAARNILLAEDNIVKICDFGLAKTMYNDENYKKKGDAPLPIKWMAIESIRDRVFSTQSDIWSFGIVLWEFFTLAETPYPGMEAEKQYQKLIEGYRMEKPEFSTADIYDIMLQCWRAKPTLRPTFTDLVESIGSLLDESVKMHYLDLNIPYTDMNTLTFESGKNDYLTMMSAPDHATLSSPTTREYVNSPNIPQSPATDCSYISMTPVNPKDDTRIFSPRNLLEKSHFDFPSPEPICTNNSDSESEAVEISPMIKNEEDNYLKPINVQERRAEFARHRHVMKNAMNDNKSMERDSGYCNAPQNPELLGINNDGDINDKSANDDEYDSKNINSFTPVIIKTEDNYVNMPKQKNDLRKDTPDSFTNPSYVFMANRENDEAKV